MAVLLRALCAHRPLFTSKSHCSVLLTLLWWIANHQTCGTHLSSAPSCPSQSILSEKSHSFLSLLHWELVGATLRLLLIQTPSRFPVMIPEAPLQVCPGSALSLCFPGRRDSCLLQPWAPLAGPHSATLLRNPSGDLEPGRWRLLPHSTKMLCYWENGNCLRFGSWIESLVSVLTAVWWWLLKVPLTEHSLFLHP